MTLSTHRPLFRVRRLSFVVVGLATAGMATLATARPTQPSAADRQITFAVTTLMERQHLTAHRLDDTISERCLKTFVKDLDPLKLFFRESDIEEFNKSKDR